LSARTIGEDLAHTAARTPDAPVVVTSEGELTYAELDAAADRLASGLADLGVERGDRVSMLLPNGLDAVVSIYGVMRAGAVLSPLHPTVKAAKLTQLLGAAGSRVLITDSQHAETARAAAGANVAVVEEPRGLSGTATPPRPISVDRAAILYTSGSTGEPHGVTLRHSNMAFVADSIIESLDMTGDDRVLSVLPLSFGYGLYQLLTSVRTGGTVFLEPGVGLIGRLIGLLEEQRITFLPGVPTVFEMLIGFESLGERQLPHLRALSNAGAGLPDRTAQAIRRLLPGASLYCMYGQTECQRVCTLPPGELDDRLGSVGLAIPGTEAWIEDDAGLRLGPGEVGELFVRGAHVMEGYWNDPEGTARKLRPGPAGERILATGDLFRTDDDGYLYFVSRRDDIIKSRGEKVVPREVEDVLRSAEGVREAAVVGVPDRLLGQAVQAHVSAQPGFELKPRALLAHCAAQLEDYMVPRRVIVHDELPKTTNGKLDRLALTGARRPD
jgi:amino acid adenylation domain-containing protein